MTAGGGGGYSSTQLHDNASHVIASDPCPTPTYVRVRCQDTDQWHARMRYVLLHDRYGKHSITVPMLG
jgi:hypothetical protein